MQWEATDQTTKTCCHIGPSQDLLQKTSQRGRAATWFDFVQVYGPRCRKWYPTTSTSGADIDLYTSIESTTSCFVMRHIHGAQSKYIYMGQRTNYLRYSSLIKVVTPPVVIGTSAEQIQKPQHFKVASGDPDPILYIRKLTCVFCHIPAYKRV